MQIWSEPITFIITTWMAGSLAENIGAIVSGEAKPRAVVTYVMAGVTVALLLATTTWATILIRCDPGPHSQTLCNVA